MAVAVTSYLRTIAPPSALTSNLLASKVTNPTSTSFINLYHRRASSSSPGRSGASTRPHPARSFREIKRWKEKEGSAGRGRRQNSTSVGGIVVGGMTLAAGGISAVIMANV